jgi:hypothetical protein
MRGARGFLSSSRDAAGRSCVAAKRLLKSEALFLRKRKVRDYGSDFSMFLPSIGREDDAEKTVYI